MGQWQHLYLGGKKETKVCFTTVINGQKKEKRKKTRKGKKDIYLVQPLYNIVKTCRLDGNLQSHLFVGIYRQPVGFGAQRGRSWEVADTELLHTTAHWVIGGARRTESVVPRSQLQWGGASASDLPSLCLPSCWERWRYQQICVCSATPQISPLQIASGWGNGTWLGFWNDYWWQCPSGAAFLNVPINFTCPALFCFH